MPLFARSAVGSLSEGLFPTASSSTESSFKLTHLFRTAHQVTARYAFSGANISREVLGSDNFSDESVRGSSLNRDQSLAVSWQAVGGPHLINEVRLQLARRKVSLSPNSQGALLEIPGVVSFGQSPVDVRRV